MRGRPETWAKLGPMPDPIATVGRDLDAAISRARHVGVDKTRIVVDPGLGFGKRKEQNSTILARLGDFAALDLPLMTGPSRKSFLAHPDPEENRFATAAAVAVSILGGAHIVRVHEIREMRAVAEVTDEILRARAEKALEAETQRPPQRPSSRPR
jgi:dihydropteroate synthase